MTNEQSICIPLMYNHGKLFVLLSLTRTYQHNFSLLVRSCCLFPDDLYLSDCGHRDRWQTCRWVRTRGRSQACVYEETRLALIVRILLLSRMLLVLFLLLCVKYNKNTFVQVTPESTTKPKKISFMFRK